MIKKQRRILKKHGNITKVGEVRLLKLVAENFLTIRSASLNFENRGLVLVEGPNGAGKSALVVEPLCFALFGVSERYGKARDQVVNRFVGRDCHVGVSLSLDNTLVEVDVYRKHTLYKDNVFLKVNGKDQRGNSNEQTWDKIVKLLDMDYTAFTNSVVFGQALSQYFSGLSDAAQKEVVERLLGITWIPDAYEVAKKDSAECLNLISSVESEYSSILQDLENAKRELLDYKRRYEEFEDEKSKKAKELESSFENKSGTSNLEKDIKSLKQRKEKVGSDLGILNDNIVSLDKEVVRSETEAKSFEKDIRKIESSLSAISSVQIGSICEFCGQKITTEAARHYEVHLSKDKARALHALSGIGARIDKSKVTHSQWCSHRDKIEAEVSAIGGKLSELDLRLNEINLSNARIEERNEQLKVKIKEIKESTNIYAEFVNKLEKEASKKEQNLQASEGRLTTLKSEIKYHRFWEEGFSNRGLKSFVIEAVIPQMNQFAYLYSNALGGKFSISFSAQKALKKGELREKFYVDVLNKVGSQCYEGNSNGERRAIDSIVMFVLGDLAASRSNRRFSVLILDDVFEKLDEEICDSIIKILHTMTSQSTEGLPRRESIFVLTHLEYFKSKFENRITVERRHGSETIYREN